MDAPMDDPKPWLKLAEDAHEIAKQLADDSMKNVMEEIAAGYERIAANAVHNAKRAHKAPRYH